MRSNRGVERSGKPVWMLGTILIIFFFFLDCILLNLELFWAVTSEASVYSPEMLP